MVIHLGAIEECRQQAGSSVHISYSTDINRLWSALLQARRTDTQEFVQFQVRAWLIPHKGFTNMP